MLPLLLIAQLNIPPQSLPRLQQTTPRTPQGIDSRLQQQRMQQLEEQLNRVQKQYELEKQQQQNLPPSRIDCLPLFPPVSGFPPGSDAISCSSP